MSKIITDVPEGWKIQRLKSVCNLRKRTKLPSLREIANIPMNLIPEDGIYVNFIMKSIDDIKSGDICKEGDILLAGITPSFENGKQGIVPPLPSKYAITTTEAFPLICGSNVESHFIFYLLKYEFTRRIIASRMEGSTGRQRIPSDVLMNFHIPVPPLVEQRGIVEVLGTVDECIRLTDAVIERAEELKRGLMQQLLTRGIGHTDYKETPLGEIPKNWKITTLAKEFNIIDCKHRTPEYVNEGYPCIRPRDIQPFITDLSSANKTSYEDYLDMIEKYEPKKGDIVYSRNASYGVSGYVLTDEKFSIGQDTIIITSKNHSTKYLYYFLNSPFIINYVQRISTGSTFKRINLKEIKKIRFSLPPVEEQYKISDILWKIDSRILKENEIKTKTLQLKQGLLQSLLSGKIRVELKGDELQRIGDSREANN